MRELVWFPLLEDYAKTSGYGQRVDPITGAPGSFHGGVDYGAPHGAPVIAPWDGIVTTGYEAGGAGNWSWVDDGPYRFKSFHHASPAVWSGWVAAGTVIAYIDSTGSSTGSHAHLELWDHGTRIDPTGYFDRAPLYHPEDEMTEDDWHRLEQIVDASINEAMKLSYTGARALAVDGDPGVYELVITGDGEVARRHIPTPDQIRMLQWADHLAGTGDGQTRRITDPAMREAFLALPVV